MGRPIEQGPECPEELVYIWNWLCEIYQGKPLTHGDLYHYKMTSNPDVLPWEAKLLIQMSNVHE